MNRFAISSAIIAGLIPFAVWAEDSPESAEAPSIWERETLTGNWGGLRGTLGDAGLTISGVYTIESLGNPSGGIRQRGVVMGNIELDADGDLDKLLGLEGATFHISAFSLHGRGLSSHFIGNLFTVRDIEAAPNTRLWAMWLQQSFLDDHLSIKIGQIPEQEEFMNSLYGSYFLNGTFGWPIGFAQNMPGGGGAYPLAMTGARIKVVPTDNLIWLSGVFNGEPAAGLKTGEDPTRRNPDGLNFELRKPPAIFNELQWTIGKSEESTLPLTTVRFGSWYHTGAFSDLRYNDAGVSLANPAVTGTARSTRGDWEIYGVVDTMLYKEANSEDRGLGAFLRWIVGESTVNAMPYYGEFGLTYKGLLEGRDDDVAGIGVTYGAISDRLRGLDQDQNRYNAANAPVRDYEALIEVLYRGQVAPWLTLTPDVQYIIHPGAGAASTDSPHVRIPDALVIGLRGVIKL